MEVNDEIVYTRAMSIQTGTRVQAFRDQVRERDGRCVVTKLENPGKVFGLWRGFEAAHIFPLAYEQQWHEHNYSRWVTLPPPRGGTINSVQNGLLLRSDLHQLFDYYDFSINPDVSI
jgi:HNH endonuclease